MNDVKLRERFAVRVACALALLLTGGPLVGVVAAGGGPENLLLLVNARSEGSKAIANHYIQLREIPANNVLYIDWTESVERVPVATWRTKLMRPVLDALARRGLSEQIDYVIYSSDFPWSVDLAADFAEVQLPPQLQPAASINGVTYLWQLVSAGSRDVLSLQSNAYVKRPDSASQATHSHGFRSWYGWGPGGALLESGGQSYLLSTMLGVTSGRGNTVDEVINYLERSAKADGTHPKGTIYYLKNGDVRSTTRQWAFGGAVKELEQLGVQAKIVDGRIPDRLPDVQGAMIGTADFNWENSQSTILPGAICEHLTSLGGVLSKNSGQTPLTEFLRHGAAGASGTVTEPYAIQDKFPLAAVHVHYARGCTLAESFYQSVAGPYQLLIVGDPLCRPWATIPKVTVAGLEANQTLRGTIPLRPAATIAGGHAVDHFELFVDGRRMGRCRPEESIDFDTLTLADGYHEVRMVAIEAGPIQSQGRLILPVMVANRGLEIEFAAVSAKETTVADAIKLSARCPGATAITVLHNNRPLGKINGAQGELSVEAKQLGAGPVTLQAIGECPERVNSRPILLRIQ